MRAHFIRKIGFLAFKLALLAAVIGLGIVFVPDKFIERVETGVSSALGYLSGQAEQRMPEAKGEISRKFQETKEEARDLYRKFQEEQWPALKGWFIGKFIN